MNKIEMHEYFEILKGVLQKNGLMEKLGSIYNMNETGAQLDNEPDKFVAAKGSKSVHVVSSAEGGETVTVVACINAEGTFLLPYCIMKENNFKEE